MDTTFKSTARRRHVIHRPDGNDIVISRGNKRFQDKDEIKYLLGHPDFATEHIQLDTPPELVNQYLEGGEPDKLTSEVLDEVNLNGLKELSDYFGTKGHGYYPTVMKQMLIGKYIDDRVESIINTNEIESEEEKVEDILQFAKDNGLVIHNAPWYVFVPLEKGIGRNTADATMWLEKNRETLDEEIEKLKS